MRIERARRVTEHGLVRRTHILEGRGWEDPIAGDDILGVLGEEAEGSLARLELAGLSGALGVVAAERDGQHRAGRSHKGPALERGDRDERPGIADESAE